MTSHLLIYILTGIGIGIVSEIGANALSLWRYAKPWLPLTNITIMFGLVCGSIAYFSPSWITVFLAAALIGTIYEIINCKLTHWWSFPNNQMGPIKGIVPICIALAIAWGVVPVIILGILSVVI